MSSSSGIGGGQVFLFEVIEHFVLGEAGGAVKGGSPAFVFLLLDAAFEADHAAREAGLELVVEFLKLSAADGAADGVVGQQQFVDGEALALVLVEQKALAKDAADAVGKGHHGVVDALGGNELQVAL